MKDVNPPRRQRARKALSGVAIIAGAAGLGFALAWNAGLFGDEGARAAEREAARMEAARRAEERAFTEAYLAHEAREVQVEQGESLFGLLARAGA